MTRNSSKRRRSLFQLSGVGVGAGTACTHVFLSQCSFAVYMCLLVFWSVRVCSVCSRVCVHELALAHEMRNPVVVLTDSRGTKQSSSATLSGNRPYMALIGWVCFLFALGVYGRGVAIVAEARCARHVNCWGRLGRLLSQVTVQFSSVP